MTHLSLYLTFVAAAATSIALLILALLLVMATAKRRLSHTTNLAAAKFGELAKKQQPKPTTDTSAVKIIVRNELSSQGQPPGGTPP
jgi:ABC-type transporter MlaC component